MLPLFLLLFFCSLESLAETQHKLYRAFGEPIAQKIPVITARLQGQCLQQSRRIKREDAFRCSAEDKIYDPCFINPFGSQQQAICPQSPWTAASVQLNLPTAVNYEKQQQLDLSRALPWGMELRTGEHCLAIDEGEIFDQMPVHYHCNNRTILAGHLQRCKTQWSILQRRPDGSVATAEVTMAWF